MSGQLIYSAPFGSTAGGAAPDPARGALRGRHPRRAHLAGGGGRRRVPGPRGLLDARPRQRPAPVAPPHGLTLEEVAYPADDELAAQAERARTTRRLSC